MITRIREVRRARKLTLEEVALRCDPPTTPQTIGRLETGTRTVSVGWLNRIAAALEVDAADLVEGAGDKADLPVAAILGRNGAAAPKSASVILGPRPQGGQIGLLVAASTGDYRAGDEVWMDSLDPGSFARALNRDVLVPRPAGRFVFGRLINRDAEKLQILPLEPGGRQQVVANPPWIGMAVRLVRAL